MQQLSIEFKNKVSVLLNVEYQKRGIADTPFLKQYGIDKYACNKILNGKTEAVLSEPEWFRLGRKLGVLEITRKWNLARTDVFTTIEQDILFCKEFAKAKICVDECGIGKTYTAKYLASTLKNCFYVDASQGKTTLAFTQQLAKALGINGFGTHSDIKEDIKCYLKMIDKPIVIVDEAGDFTQTTMQDIKEFWNATEGFCGWYLMGADGLKYIMQKGIKNRKPGFKEVFSRFSDRYTTTVPIGKDDKLSFYKKLVTDVLTVNMADKSRLNEIVKKCLVLDGTGNISGLRRAESLLLLYQADDKQQAVTETKIDTILN